MDELGPLAELYILLIIVYLIDCIRWVGRASVCLRSFVPGSWHFVAPWQIATQWRRALAFTAPWPPLGALHVIDGLPVLMGPEGITFADPHPGGWSRPGASSLHVPWSEVSRVKLVDGELCVDGKPRVVLGTRRMANSLSALLSELAEARPARRPALIEKYLEKRWDTSEIRARRRVWRTWGTPLGVASNLLFVAVFGGTGAVLFTSLGRYWLFVLAAGVLLWLVTAVMWHLAAIRVLPPGIRPSWGRFVLTVITPVSLVRGADEIRAELYGELEPGAVALEYLSGDALRQYARWTVAELMFPLEPADGPAAAQALRDEEWLRQKRLDLARTAFARANVDLDTQREVVPTGGTRAWCPRCQTQYAVPAPTCSNCPGVPLRSAPQVETQVASSGSH